MLRTRKGLDWTDKFGAIAKAGESPARLHYRRRDRRARPQRRAGFRGAAGGAVRRQDRSADLFRLRSAVRGRRRSAPSAAVGAQAAARTVPERQSREEPGTHIRYVEHFDSGGDAVLQSACRMSLEGIVSKKLDAPYRSGRGDDWTKSKCRAGHEVVIGGWDETEGRFRSLLVGVHRGKHLVYVGKVGTGYGRDTVARIFPRMQEARNEREPVRRRQRAEARSQCPLGEAGARRRDRIRGLDRRRQCAPGGLQGLARRQAGR